MILREIFVSKRDEVTAELRRLPNEELNYLCYTPNDICVIKSRRMGWARHVARMERRGAYRGFVRKPEEKSYMGDLGVDGYNIKINF